MGEQITTLLIITMKEMLLGNPGTKTPSNLEYSSNCIIATSDLFCNNIRNFLLNLGYYR